MLKHASSPNSVPNLEVNIGATGRNPWPWIALTLAAGSFGPLLYLFTRKQPTT